MNEIEIARLFVTAATAIIALIAWFTSKEALHRADRPVLRPVPLRIRATGHIHPAELILKNIGVGAAIAVMMFEDRRATEPLIIGETDYIEPLGSLPPEGETARAGRFRLELDQARWLQDSHTYRIVYQDISGHWHETRLTVTGRGFEARYLGRRRRRTIPKAALERAQVVRSFESI